MKSKRPAEGPYAVLEYLKKSGEASISGISDNFGYRRQVAVYFISKLEDLGLIDHRYRVLEKPTKERSGKAEMVFFVKEAVAMKAKA